ncbi:hypothetical protein EFO81_04365 [Lactiplantibacillus plantarum]|uniref:hypothetical protein n=1 Tax=Lactiplantibacillus plantarum TaxID=1590 RepID=UPI0021A6DE91|nr:hypothetical protein [Lactiplantibacillus plantarum]MCT3221922.1 hypothetical protein [Lactiplantibacillus plantarum]
MIIKLTRTELYNYIWTDGISRTAQNLNTTANKIKTAAINADIPLPNNSYWGHLHMGTSIPKTKLPNPADQLIISIPEHKKRTRYIHVISEAETINSVTGPIKSKCMPNLFTEIPLKNSNTINQAFLQIKVPKTMPVNPVPLISELIKQQREEKRADKIGSFYVSSKSTINFHGRFGMTPSKEALIILNTLLKAFNRAGASIALTEDKKDILITLEGAILTLSCHIPSHQVLLKPDDKRWTDWHDTDYEPTDEKICFGIRLQHAWNVTPIHHKKGEYESDYVKRIFTKAIQLIPNSRKIVQDDQLQKIKREEEEKQQVARREQHDNIYNDLKELLENARTHWVAELLKAYIQHVSFKDKEALNVALHLANWLDGQEKDDVLNKSDREQLVSEFFKNNDQHNIFQI